MDISLAVMVDRIQTSANIKKGYSKDLFKTYKGLRNKF
jgi:hypothetical protein